MRLGRVGFNLSYRRQLVLFLAPYLVGTLVLVALPALATVAVSFTNYQAIEPPTWTGLDNFRRLAETPLVRLGLYNTLVFAGLAVPLRLVGALALALLLGRRSPRSGSGLYRAAVYLPTIMPEAAYALVWLWILNPVYGPLNMILAAFGLPQPAWLAEAGTARLAVVLMALMQLGEGFVVVLAARQNVPAALYEAAEVDGANRWQGFWRITLPLILPWLLLLACRDLVAAVQNTFTPSFVLAYGGPYYATTFLPLLIYEISFDFADWGLASAVLVVVYAWILLLIFGIRNLIEGLRGRVEADEG
ncbi:MAG: sugar ABC transporter permease [Anaerolineae bacterium]|nr:sugar ABC transporter permease [Anaerolineae bacterium]